MALYDYYKSIEQIAAGLAHEAKNPLSLVKANIDLLEIEDQKKAYTKNYNIMRREIDKINDLLLDFIQFTKPIDANLEKLEIYGLIAELVEDLKFTYGDKVDIHLNIDPSAKDIYLLCDESKIKRVFVNIIKNAIEALEKDGRIEINITKVSTYLRIETIDNGKGLTKDALEKISSPFYTTKSGGSGLGLFISKNIINEHNGLFEIIGQETGGCKVSVLLPIFNA